MWMYVALYSTYSGARTAADKMHDVARYLSKVDRGDIFIVHGQKSSYRTHLVQTLSFRAATNDYFDNRLVGRLFFRLIGLNTIIYFIDKKHTIPHSAKCPSNNLNAMKTYSA